MHIGPYTYEEYVNLIRSFHGSTAPGMIIGGFMVDLALRNLPEGEFFDAICETRSCLPDAVQLLTPCTIGNGWLTVENLGRYALTLYEKYGGQGVRVWLDSAKIEKWPEIKTWFFKLKPKKEQDAKALFEQIEQAGTDLCSIGPVKVLPRLLKKKGKGPIATCPVCSEAYPVHHGAMCLACQGITPYEHNHAKQNPSGVGKPHLKVVPIERVEGKRLLHDMTRILPGKEKGAAFVRGQVMAAGDICRLQQMGRMHVYVEEEPHGNSDWVHEDDAALAFARAMAGEGVTSTAPPREGKVNFAAARDGLFLVDEKRLEVFNLMPGVMCASRQGNTVVAQDSLVAGTRAIPLYLARADFDKALAAMQSGPLFRVVPMRRAQVGILVTGTEVFKGLIEDSFAPIIRTKVDRYGCTVVKELIVPDDAAAIRDAIRSLVELGADLVITTAGLSVDPDDLTRQGLEDAGVRDILYGAPVLPGAMTLLGRLGDVQVFGVPACALYFKTTAFDLLLPRLLAGQAITRQDLARLGHGSYCLGCTACTYPHCPFGK
ncbi:MAG: FmdE family protein [Desulfomonilia bacterium]